MKKPMLSDGEQQQNPFTALSREELAKKTALKIAEEILGKTTDSKGHPYDESLIFRMVDEALIEAVIGIQDRYKASHSHLIEKLDEIEIKGFESDGSVSRTGMIKKSDLLTLLQARKD